MHKSINSPSQPSLRSLHPGNFAMVMATGILSIGFSNLQWPVMANLLFSIAGFLWITLVLLSAARCLLYFTEVKTDLLHPRMVFSYFTFVAATDIVGILLSLRGIGPGAIACWGLAFCTWCALLYLSFSVLTFLTHEHNVNIVHGGWLISIVGTQSLVLLGARIAPVLGSYSNAMLIEVHMLWGLGLIFYCIFVTLFCYRIFFLTLKPDQISPLLWVVMGASATCANAGTGLLATNTTLPFLAAQRPFIEGLTMMAWTWATWWVPMLGLFFFWKHVTHRVPLQYEPALWSAVFPLGMYAVSSNRLGLAADFEPLQWISAVMLWMALLAFCLTWFAFFKDRIEFVRVNTAA